MSGLRRVLLAVTAGIVLLLLYLLLWPVPIEPVAWKAPADTGLTGAFAPNDRLRGAALIELGPHHGPEDIAGGPDGRIYVGTGDGAVLRLRPDGTGLAIFAETGGRPLGLAFDAAGDLLVANAYLGLQRVSTAGEVTTLVDSFDGRAILYANDVAVAPDGQIYFTDSSTRFGAGDAGGSYEASLLDLLEHGGHGRVLRFDPATGETSRVLDGLNFANGIAIGTDPRFLLVCETGSYRVLRHWLDGPEAGRTEVVIDKLPGFPDNIDRGLDGRYWIGLVSPRNRVLDAVSDEPWLRRVVQRLPGALRPRAAGSSHLIAIGADGEVRMDLQDPAARLPYLTGAHETPDALWMSSLFGSRVGRLDGLYPVGP
ncbi:MAG: SMP-30/gluconolactonase/LRE family protein [Acidobacteriota bacterium]|jgi:sugar lactone lactonase YvrE